MPPPGWTFEQHQDTDANANIICHFPEAAETTNWPTEQINQCAAMPNCLAVSYSEAFNWEILTPSICYKLSGDNLTTASAKLMPQACMGTMVKNGERRIGGWGGWRRLWKAKSADR